VKYLKIPEGLVSGSHPLAHREYWEATAKILTYYGFAPRLEHWSRAGRLDVFGHCARREVCGETTASLRQR